MANTLTGLIPTIYTALDQVSRELIGFIPNVQLDSAASGAAVGQTVRAPVAGTSDLEDIVAGADAPSTGDSTHGYVDVTISKSKAYPIKWSGEEQLSVGANGEYNTILADQFVQGFRALSNAVEADLAGQYLNFARAVTPAGTNLFDTANNHADFADTNRALDESGAPQTGRIMILGSAARATLEGVQSGLFKANEAGTDAMLRNRINREMHGFQMGYSAGIKAHAAEAFSGYLVNGTPSAGATTIPADTGQGGLPAGTVISFANHDAKYVVKTALSGGSFELSTGLLVAVPNNSAITVESHSYTANMAFHRNALLLAARAPAMPVGGDSADDVMTVTDPVSGLSFQVALYRRYREVKMEIGLSWGVATPNGKHGVILAD